jgi:hypothetical protein
MSRSYIDPRAASIAASRDRRNFWRSQLALAADRDSAQMAKRCVARYEDELRRLGRDSLEDIPGSAEHALSRARDDDQ